MRPRKHANKRQHSATAGPYDRWAVIESFTGWRIVRVNAAGWWLPNEILDAPPKYIGNAQSFATEAEAKRLLTLFVLRGDPVWGGVVIKAIPQPGQNFTLMESGPYKFWAIQRYGRGNVRAPDHHLGWRPGYAWRVVPCNAYGKARSRWNTEHDCPVYVSNELYESEEEAKRALTLKALAGGLTT